MMIHPHNPVVQRIVNSVVDTPQEVRGLSNKQETTEELEAAVGQANDVLVRATTVFPFTLFPDTVSLDRAQFSVTRRDIFKAGEVFSIRIEDILSITADVNLFFGTIKLATRFFDPDKPYTVKFLKRKDALKIKRITQGYLVARQRDIDCSAFGTHELATMLDEMGQVAPEERV